MTKAKMELLQQQIHKAFRMEVRKRARYWGDKERSMDKLFNVENIREIVNRVLTVPSRTNSGPLSRL